MFPCLQSFFDAHLSSLLNGDLKGFVLDYDFPLALFVEGRTVVYPSPVILADSSAAYRACLIGKGISRFSCRINAVDIPRQHRFRAWVTVFAHRADTGATEQTESIYFLRDKRGLLLIEMVDCIETPDSAFVQSRRGLLQAG